MPSWSHDLSAERQAPRTHSSPCNRPPGTGGETPWSSPSLRACSAAAIEAGKQLVTSERSWPRHQKHCPFNSPAWSRVYVRPQNTQGNVSSLEQLHDPRPRRREKEQVNEEEVRDVVGLYLRFGNLCGRRGAVEEIQVTFHSLDHEVERPTPSVSQRQWACRWHGSTALRGFLTSARQHKRGSQLHLSCQSQQCTAQRNSAWRPRTWRCVHNEHDVVQKQVSHCKHPTFTVRQHVCFGSAKEKSTCYKVQVLSMTAKMDCVSVYSSSDPDGTSKKGTSVGHKHPPRSPPEGIYF